jgi:hypothetical protein
VRCGFVRSRGHSFSKGEEKDYSVVIHLFHAMSWLTKQKSSIFLAKYAKVGCTNNTGIVHEKCFLARGAVVYFKKMKKYFYKLSKTMKIILKIVSATFHNHEPDLFYFVLHKNGYIRYIF